MNINKATTSKVAVSKRYIEINPTDLNTITKSFEQAAKNARPGEMVEYEIAPGLVFLFDPNVTLAKENNRLTPGVV